MSDDAKHPDSDDEAAPEDGPPNEDLPREQPPEESLPDVPLPPEQPEEGEPLEHVIDDVEAREEAHAWAYMEIKRGRLAEDVHADLVAKGWDWDDAEGLVESARKSPGAVEAASRAAPFHRRRGGILGAIINGIVGIVTAILGVKDDDDSPDAARRADRARRVLCTKCSFDLHGRGGECPNCGTMQPPRETS